MIITIKSIETASEISVINIYNLSEIQLFESLKEAIEEFGPNKVREAVENIKK